MAAMEWRVDEWNRRVEGTEQTMSSEENSEETCESKREGTGGSMQLKMAWTTMVLFDQKFQGNPVPVEMTSEREV